MSEFEPKSTDRNDDITVGQALQRVEERYFNGENVTAEVKRLYSELDALWYYRATLGIEWEVDNLTEQICTLELMLPKDQVPKPFGAL